MRSTLDVPEVVGWVQPTGGKAGSDGGLHPPYEEVIALAHHRGVLPEFEPTPDWRARLSVHLVVGEREPQFLEDAGLFVAHRFGSDAPLVGDLGGRLAHQRVADQGGLARAKSVLDGLQQGLSPRPSRAVLAGARHLE